MAVSHPVVIRDNWETYCYHAENGPVFVSFYAGAGGLSRDDEMGIEFDGWGAAIVK